MLMTLSGEELLVRELECDLVSDVREQVRQRRLERW